MFKEYPKMIEVNGIETVVNSKEEEHALKPVVKKKRTYKKRVVEQES